jgi:acylglycerol lipase
MRALSRVMGVVLAAFAMALGCAPPHVDLRPPPTPARTASSGAEAVRHQTGSFTGARGTPLFQQSWRPAGTPRAAVVIHHGLKSHSDHYVELAARLVARGFAVHAYDMRGHGRSAGRRATLDDFGDLISDLSAFLDRVRAREPGRPVFVIGHSVGGAVVTLHQIERRPALAGLILLAPALRIDRMPFEAAATPVVATLAPNAPVVDVPDEHFSRSPDVVREMGEDPLIYHPAAPARTASAILDALGRIWAHPEAVTVPLLALHGTADQATDPRGSAELVSRAGTRDRTLLLYRGLYHDLVREPERDQIMRDVERWLDQHAPAKP